MNLETILLSGLTYSCMSITCGLLSFFACLLPKIPFIISVTLVSSFDVCVNAPIEFASIHNNLVKLFLQLNHILSQGLNYYSDAIQ